MATTNSSFEVPKFRFSISDEIYWKWYKDEALLGILEGELGAGKSSNVIQMLMELYPDETWKKYLVFKPEHFLGLVNELIMHKPLPKKVPLIVWDDAGLWLYALDWADPRVKSVVKFINVMRTVVGALILTTPTREMVVKKIPTIPGTRMGRITRAGTNEFSRAAYKEMRHVIWARTIVSSWGRKWTKDYIDDTFNVMLPRDVYSYYKPLRDQYATEAYTMMREAWESRLKVSSNDIGDKQSPD